MHARGPRARRGPVAASVASRSRVHGRSRARFLLRARVFRGPVVVSGCRNVSRGRAVVFHFRQSRRRGSLSKSLRLSTFAVETLLALRSAALPSWRGVAAKRKLEIIAKPLGLLHEALLSGRSFLRAETRSYSLVLQRVACRLPICLVRCSPIFAVCHLLRRSRCARALSPLCFRCVRFVELRWCGS